MPSSPCCSAASRSFAPSSKVWTRCRHGISERLTRRSKRRRRCFEEQWPKIVSVTVQEVEGEEHELVLLCLPRCEPEPVEVRSAIRVWQDELAVEQSGAAPERQEGRCEAGEPIGPLDATAAVEAHLAAVLDDLEAIAVKLELVQPGFSDRRLLGRGRDTGTNEARRRRHL